jgi:hypothetical protein
MTGRVFEDSTGTDEDQARILVDYLADAARKIVAEEERIEEEILQREQEQKRLSSEKGGFKNRLMVAVGGVVLTALLAFVFSPYLLLGSLLAAGKAFSEWRQLTDLDQKIEELGRRIDVFKSEHKAIKRDYQVQRLAVAYVPIATRVPFEDGNVLIDHSGTVQQQDFSLYLVRDQDAFVENIQALEESVRVMPVVEGTSAMEEVDTSGLSRSIQNVTYGDYLGNLDRSMRSSAFLLNDLEHLRVDLPIADPVGDFSRRLSHHGSTDTAGAPVLPLFPTDAHAEALEAFARLNAMRRSMESRTLAFEEFLQSLMERLAATVQVVTRSKIASTSLIASQGNRMLYTSLKAAYNHYSPQLEAQEIDRIRSESFDYQASVDGYRPFALKQSSRVRYDLLADNWVAEDGRRTVFPFGVHQIQEEVIAPVVEALMKETRLERLRLYENIKDQKLDYLNQWHRDTDDFYARNRAEGSNLINLMQASLTDFMTAYNQYESFDKTRKSMEEGNGTGTVVEEGADAASLVTYRAKMDAFLAQQAEFNTFAERLKDEIAEDAAAFGYIEYYDASLRDRPARNFATALASMHTLDERRRPLALVNPYFAATADLPPRPDVDLQVQETLALDLRSAAAVMLGLQPTASAPVGAAPAEPGPAWGAPAEGGPAPDDGTPAEGETD